jgi:hypothetical protein
VVANVASCSALTTAPSFRSPPGAAGNTVPISYVSGTSTSKIIFPEIYQGLNAMSICTVTRYTSPTLNRARIFQPFRSTANWLHGQVRAPLWMAQPRLRFSDLRALAILLLAVVWLFRYRLLQRLAVHVAGDDGDGVGLHLLVVQPRH